MRHIDFMVAVGNMCDLMAHEEHKRAILDKLSVVAPNFVSWCHKLFTCPHSVRVGNIEVYARKVCAFLREVPYPRKERPIGEHPPDEQTQKENEACMNADKVAALLAGSEGVNLRVEDKVKIDWREA